MTVSKVGSQELITIPILASDGSSFSAETMSGGATTSAFDVRGLDYVQVFASVASVTGTVNVTISPLLGPSDSDINYPVQTESVDTGVGTLSDYTLVKSVTTEAKYSVVIPTQRASYMTLTFTATSGTIDAVVRGGTI